MFNGVSAFWAIFCLTAILFGFQNCGPSNLGVGDLVANTSLNSLIQNDFKDTGYYGGQNFKFTQTDNGSTLQELLLSKNADKSNCSTLA